MGMFKATLYSSLITTSLKYTIREKRPNNPSEKNSFPSGHTTTAFAFSGYVLAEHGWTFGAPAIALSLLTAYSRINDNRHYLHDVLAGATIGLAYGLSISLQDQEKDSYSFAPIIDKDIKGIVLRTEF